MQPMVLKKPQPYRLCFFDFETQQKKIIYDRNGKGKYLHEPVFVGAYITCSECIENGKWRSSLAGNNSSCRICGNFRSIAFAPFEFQETKVDYKEKTDNPLNSFVDFLLNKTDPKFKNICFAHNGGRFDSIMVYKNLFERGICPQMIRRGNKLIEMSARGKFTDTIFRDSYNLTHMPLAAFVKAFDLELEDKMHFPYLYCREENFNTTLPNLPDIEFYTPNTKKPKLREQLLEWYEQHRQEPFNLNEKLAEYCMSDNEILMHGMIRMREEFLEITKKEPTKQQNSTETDEEALETSFIESEFSMEEEEEEELEQVIKEIRRTNIDNGDPPSKQEKETKKEYCGGFDILLYARTIASAAMKIFQLKFLQPQTLAIVPENSYNTFNDNQSEIALKFMKYLEELWNVEIRNSESPEGEYEVPGTKYRLDGYIKGENGQKDIGIEFHGCTWHAHEKCFPNPQDLMPSGKTCDEIRKQHQKRMDIIKSSPNLEIQEYWECEVREQLKNDKDMKKLFDKYKVTTPALHIRDGFCGGRTAPARIHFKAENGWKIKYRDYTSLYPWTQTTCYPIKHPEEMIIVPKSQREVNWCKPEDIPWKGFIKVLVYCPREINPPVTVLPLKMDERLLFPTCALCAAEHPMGGKINDYSCPHSDEERAFVWTGTTIELEQALKEGYRVSKVYSALHFENWSDTIFRGYVADCMQMKMHASGFEPGMTEEEKDVHIEECDRMFGIKIDKNKMKLNNSKRSVAKLLANSHWGKMAQKSDMEKSITTDSPAMFRRYLDDPKVQVNSVFLITDEVIMINYSMRKDFITPNRTNNIGAAAWTTSRARLRLFEALKAVAVREKCEDPSTALLYYDTDSVIYAYKDGTPDPLEHLSGPHLGQLKDELPNAEILEFCSCGPKNYAYKFRDNKTGKEKHEMKVRGLVLDYNTCQQLHYENFKSKCLNYGEVDEEPMTIHYEREIRPDVRKGQVTATPFSKIFRSVLRKGILKDDYKLYEYGHV